MMILNYLNGERKKDGTCPPSTCKWCLEHHRLPVWLESYWLHLVVVCILRKSMSCNRVTSTILSIGSYNPKFLRLFLLQAHKLHLPYSTKVGSYGNHFCGSFATCQADRSSSSIFGQDSCWLLVDCISIVSSTHMFRLCLAYFHSYAQIALLHLVYSLKLQGYLQLASICC